MKFFFYLLGIGLSFAAQAYPVTYESNPFLGSRLYVPTSPGQHPSLLMLHGSEGGSNFYVDAEASLWAAQGYKVLVYCYFDCARELNGPRQTLRDVEASEVLTAVAWLRSQSDSDGRVTVYGVSRVLS